jgi:hypothetical protein
MSSAETVYLGLGSNLGDRQANLLEALASLAAQMELGSRRKTGGLANNAGRMRTVCIVTRFLSAFRPLTTEWQGRVTIGVTVPSARPRSSRISDPPKWLCFRG